MKYLAILIAAGIGLSGCQQKETPRPHAAAATGNRADIRELRVNVPGKSARQVLRLLGQPSTVFTLDGRESWTYRDGVTDSVTGRKVRYLEIIFVKRIAQTVNFSY